MSKNTRLVCRILDRVCKYGWDEYELSTGYNKKLRREDTVIRIKVSFLTYTFEQVWTKSPTFKKMPNFQTLEVNQPVTFGELGNFIITKIEGRS